MSNFQTPMLKVQTNSKLQTWTADLEIGFWNLFGVLCLVFVFFTAGCAGYKLGPTNGLEAGARSIQINPPSNATFEPRIAVALNQQLRKQLQRDGTYRLETRGEGDIIVTTAILRYEKIGETFVPRDTLTVRDYRVNLIAHVTAYDRISGKNIVNRDFHGHTTVQPGADQSSAERQALPLLTEDLARNITSALVDGEW